MNIFHHFIVFICFCHFKYTENAGMQDGKMTDLAAGGNCTTEMKDLNGL